MEESSLSILGLFRFTPGHLRGFSMEESNLSILALFRFILGGLPLFLPPNFLFFVSTCHLVLGIHLLQGESTLLVGFENYRPLLHIGRSRGSLGRRGF